MFPLTLLHPDHYVFPPVEEAMDEPNGLLAVGGDLAPARILTAYREGIFPWYNPGDPTLWRSPNPRTVIFPAQLHVSRSLKQLLGQCRQQVTCAQAFSAVLPA